MAFPSSSRQLIQRLESAETQPRPSQHSSAQPASATSRGRGGETLAHTANTAAHTHMHTHYQRQTLLSLSHSLSLPFWLTHPGARFPHSSFTHLLLIHLLTSLALLRQSLCLAPRSACLPENGPAGAWGSAVAACLNTRINTVQRQAEARAHTHRLESNVRGKESQTTSSSCWFIWIVRLLQPLLSKVRACALERQGLFVFLHASVCGPRGRHVWFYRYGNMLILARTHTKTHSWLKADSNTIATS